MKPWLHYSSMNKYALLTLLASCITMASGDTNYSCKPWASFTIDDTLIVNNIWGVPDNQTGNQCIYIDKNNSSYTWRWDWPGNDIHVITYPSITYGHKPWEGYTTTKQLPAKIKDISAFNVAFGYKAATSGANNLLLESWLVDSNKPDSSNIQYEVGIHFFQREWPGQAGEQIGEVTVNGQSFDVYVSPPWEERGIQFTWTYISFVAKQMLTSSAEINIDFMQFLEALSVFDLHFEHLSIASVELGSEVIHGQGEMLIYDLDISPTH